MLAAMEYCTVLLDAQDFRFRMQNSPGQRRRA